MTRWRGRSSSARRLASLLTLSGSVLGALVLPVLPAPAAAGPKPVPPKVSTVALEKPDRPASPQSTGPLVLTNEMSTEPFSALAVSWDHDRGVKDVQTAVRVRHGGVWSDWQDLEVGDAAPDDGSVDARHGQRDGTELLWVGSADGVQVRVDRPAGRSVHGLELKLIDPGRSPADATLARAKTVGGADATADVAAPPIISRAGWGADESLRSLNGPDCLDVGYGDTVKVAFIHHTDSVNDYGPQDSAAIIRSIYAFHVQGNKWCDIGYNFLVDRYGQIFEGRAGGVDRPVIGAHTYGFNTNSFAVAMIGDFSTERPPAGTMDAIAKVVAWKLAGNYRDPWGQATLTAGGTDRFQAGQAVSFASISAHRDANYTACPGDGAYGLLGDLRNRVAGYVGTGKGLIQQRWEAMGGPSSWLGQPFIGEASIPGGRVTYFDNGSLFWSPVTGVREVHGAILDHYVAMGTSTSPIGFPVADEGAAAGGRVSGFQFGEVYWSPASGAWEVHGDIRLRWLQLGGVGSPLGYPTSDEYAVTNGRASNFQNGRMYWSPWTGSHEVRGAILGNWLLLGGPGSVLGLPTSDELAVSGVSGARQSVFQFGRMYWSSSTWSQEVHGDILARYLQLGGPSGALGMPKSNEYAVAGGRQNDFEHGSLRWDAASRVVTLIQSSTTTGSK